MVFRPYRFAHQATEIFFRYPIFINLLIRKNSVRSQRISFMVVSVQRHPASLNVSRSASTYNNFVCRFHRRELRRVIGHSHLDSS
jgi:hypothetical protein